MTTKSFRKAWPALLLAGSLGAIATLNGGSALAQDSTAPSAAAQDTTQQSGQSGPRTDGQVEMDVVHALDAAPDLKQDWITAGTVQGEVTLSGTSASEGNKQLAASLAAQVPGVTKVVNNLKVGDPQTAQNENVAGQPQDQTQYADPSASQSQAQPQQPPMDQGQQQADNNAPGYAPGYQSGPRAGYQPTPPPMPQAPEPPHADVTIPQDQLLKVRTSEPLDSKKAKDGTPVEFTVVRDIYAGGVLAVPRGASVRGHVVDVKSSGALGGSPQLGLKLEFLDMGGKSYELDSAPMIVRGPNKAGRTAGNAIGGAVLGALIGGAVGGGSGAAIGAGAGAVGGTAATAATPGPRVWIPAEALMDFHLNVPVTVTPVSWQEAQRLAANAPPPSQRPTLYRRGPYPYGYYPPPPPPGYYRPY